MSFLVLCRQNQKALKNRVGDRSGSQFTICIAQVDTDILKQWKQQTRFKATKQKSSKAVKQNLPMLKQGTACFTPASSPNTHRTHTPGGLMKIVA